MPDFITTKEEQEERDHQHEVPPDVVTISEEKQELHHEVPPDVITISEEKQELYCEVQAEVITINEEKQEFQHEVPPEVIMINEEVLPEIITINEEERDLQCEVPSEVITIDEDERDLQHEVPSEVITIEEEEAEEEQDNGDEAEGGGHYEDFRTKGGRLPPPYWGPRNRPPDDCRAPPPADSPPDGDATLPPAGPPPGGGKVPPSTSKRRVYYCAVCCQYFSTGKILLQHKKSKRHKLAALEEGQPVKSVCATHLQSSPPGSDVTPPSADPPLDKYPAQLAAETRPEEDVAPQRPSNAQPYYCTVCDKWFSAAMYCQLHYKSVSHTVRAQKKQRSSVPGNKKSQRVLPAPRAALPSSVDVRSSSDSGRPPDIRPVALASLLPEPAPEAPPSKTTPPPSDVGHSSQKQTNPRKLPPPRRAPEGRPRDDDTASPPGPPPDGYAAQPPADPHPEGAAAPLRPPRARPYHCSVCSKWFTGTAFLGLHLNSPSHKRRAKEEGLRADFCRNKSQRLSAAFGETLPPLEGVGSSSGTGRSVEPRPAALAPLLGADGGDSTYRQHQFEDFEMVPPPSRGSDDARPDEFGAPPPTVPPDDNTVSAPAEPLPIDRSAPLPTRSPVEGYEAPPSADSPPAGYATPPAADPPPDGYPVRPPADPHPEGYAAPSQIFGVRPYRCPSGERSFSGPSYLGDRREPVIRKRGVLEEGRPVEPSCKKSRWSGPASRGALPASEGVSNSLGVGKPADRTPAAPPRELPVPPPPSDVGNSSLEQQQCEDLEMEVGKMSPPYWEPEDPPTDDYTARPPDPLPDDFAASRLQNSPLGSYGTPPLADPPPDRYPAQPVADPPPEDDVAARQPPKGRPYPCLICNKWFITATFRARHYKSACHMIRVQEQKHSSVPGNKKMWQLLPGFRDTFLSSEGVGGKPMEHGPTARQQPPPPRQQSPPEAPSPDFPVQSPPPSPSDVGNSSLEQQCEDLETEVGKMSPPYWEPKDVPADDYTTPPPDPPPDNFAASRLQNCPPGSYGTPPPADPPPDRYPAQPVADSPLEDDVPTRQPPKERPYHCLICDKWFTSASFLNRHYESLVHERHERHVQRNEQAAVVRNEIMQQRSTAFCDAFPSPWGVVSSPDSGKSAERGCAALPPRPRPPPPEAPPLESSVPPARHPPLPEAAPRDLPVAPPPSDVGESFREQQYEDFETKVGKMSPPHWEQGDPTPEDYPENLPPEDYEALPPEPPSDYTPPPPDGYTALPPAGPPAASGAVPPTGSGRQAYHCSVCFRYFVNKRCLDKHYRSQRHKDIARDKGHPAEPVWGPPTLDGLPASDGVGSSLVGRRSAESGPASPQPPRQLPPEAPLPWEPPPPPLTSCREQVFSSKTQLPGVRGLTSDDGREPVYAAQPFRPYTYEWQQHAVPGSFEAQLHRMPGIPDSPERGLGLQTRQGALQSLQSVYEQQGMRCRLEQEERHNLYLRWLLQQRQQQQKQQQQQLVSDCQSRCSSPSLPPPAASARSSMVTADSSSGNGSTAGQPSCNGVTYGSGRRNEKPNALPTVHKKNPPGGSSQARLQPHARSVPVTAGFRRLQPTCPNVTIRTSESVPLPREPSTFTSPDASLKTSRLCPVCGGAFSREYCLRKHVRYFHPGSEYFECWYCREAFAAYGTYRTHLAKHFT